MNSELADKESTFVASLVLLGIMGLQSALPETINAYVKFFVLISEGMLTLCLWIFAPYRHHTEKPQTRAVVLGLIALVNVATVMLLGTVIHQLLHSEINNGTNVLYYGLLLWLSNVLAFSLGYWELDGGGPAKRFKHHKNPKDFLFPNTTLEHMKNWKPLYMDYLYLSFTNSTAFSPTDTLPLSHWAKALMMLQSGISFGVMMIVVARGVNILS